MLMSAFLIVLLFLDLAVRPLVSHLYPESMFSWTAGRITACMYALWLIQLTLIYAVIGCAYWQAKDDYSRITERMELCTPYTSEHALMRIGEDAIRYNEVLKQNSDPDILWIVPYNPIQKLPAIDISSLVQEEE